MGEGGELILIGLWFWFQNHQVAGAECLTVTRAIQHFSYSQLDLRGIGSTRSGRPPGILVLEFEDGSRVAIDSGRSSDYRASIVGRR